MSSRPRRTKGVSRSGIHRINQIIAGVWPPRRRRRAEAVRQDQGVIE